MWLLLPDAKTRAGVPAPHLPLQHVNLFAVVLELHLIH
jgi:hypothetical protein